MTKKKRTIKRHAFAVLLYNVDVNGNVHVFLAQENGPRYWNRGSEKVWGLPKGRSDAHETPFAAASREFHEEIGSPLPGGTYKFFMEHVRYRARRKVTVFAAHLNHRNVRFGGSNVQVREYPAKSGEFISYAEIVDAQWFTLKQAKKVILPGQRAILKKLRNDLMEV